MEQLLDFLVIFFKPNLISKAVWYRVRLWQAESHSGIVGLWCACVSWQVMWWDRSDFRGYILNNVFFSAFKCLFTNVQGYARENHTDEDCIIIVVLSHGALNGLYARDHLYHPDILWNHFTADKCPTLAGKPKIFLVQACRGHCFDQGTRFTTGILIERWTLTYCFMTSKSGQIPLILLRFQTMQTSWLPTAQYPDLSLGKPLTKDHGNCKNIELVQKVTWVTKTRTKCFCLFFLIQMWNT